MIQASWIYAVATVLLALVDAIRIKVKWGKQKNIDHVASTALAVITALFVNIVLTIGHVSAVTFWVVFGQFWIISAAFIPIRLALYDLFLNGFRILTKTNPTLRLDYVSTKTSSYEDNHTTHLAFWDKRILAVAAWGILAFVYHLIFKVL